MNILIAEDRPIFRNTLRRILSDWFSSSTVTYAPDGASALRYLLSGIFTHLLINLQLSDLDGFDLADAAMHCTPGILILAFSAECNDYLVYRADRLRLRALVDQKVATAFNCHQAIANAEVGLCYFSPSILRLKDERMRNPQSFDKILSDREIAVLELIAAPFGDRAIATELGLSSQTVAKHRFNILRKTGLNTTADLVRYARLHGIVLHPAYVGSQAPTRWKPSVDASGQSASGGKCIRVGGFAGASCAAGIIPDVAKERESQIGTATAF